MDTGFKYRPRFKDIRIRPPGGKPAEEVTLCEYPRCQEHATAKAPKAPDRLNEHYHFCQKHAADYNKSWNFFEGMSEGAARAYAQSAAWGHRPTEFPGRRNRKGQGRTRERGLAIGLH